MTAYQTEGSIPVAHQVDPLADLQGGNWLGVTGVSGKRQQAWCRAVGLDIAPASALLSDLLAKAAPPSAQAATQGGGGFPPHEEALHVAPAPVSASQTTGLPDDGASLSTLLGLYPRLQVVVLYLSPWEALLDCCTGAGEQDDQKIADCLQKWADRHRAILAARIKATDRVLLINAGRLDHPESTRASLRERGIAVSEHLPSEEPGGALVISPALSRLLASHLAEMGREYWEVYEALESCCALFGREPEFQATADLVDVKDLTEVVASICDVQRTLWALEEDKITAGSALLVQIRDAGAAPAHVTHLLDEVQRENELLGMQLHQLYEELDYHVAYVAELRRIVNQSGQAAEAARWLIAELAGARTA